MLNNDVAGVEIARAKYHGATISAEELKQSLETDLDGCHR